MRKPRYYYLSNFYHLIVQGDEKKYIFQSYRNKKKYLYYLMHNAFRNDVEIVAYCLMDNHVHMLVFCPEIERISKMMLQTNTSFGLYYTNKRQKVGHVFRERFKGENIYTKTHLVNCIKYIHNNPVKAGMCSHMSEYYFSSYRDYENLDEKIKKLCDLTENDLKTIIKGEVVCTKFLEDEKSPDDLEFVYNQSKKLFQNILDEDEKICKQYIYMKENCRITDEEFSRLFEIKRNTLNYKLKKMGLK